MYKKTLLLKWNLKPNAKKKVKCRKPRLIHGESKNEELANTVSRHIHYLLKTKLWKKKVKSFNLTEDNVGNGCCDLK